MKESPLNLRQTQVEKLKEIGSSLKQFRESQNQSLVDLSERTRIQVRLLQAIENGKLETLPEPIYIKGFIRRYAEVLGLDGDQVAQEFPTAFVSQAPAKARRWSLPTAQLRPIHLYLLYFGLVICSVNTLSQMVQEAPLQASNSSTPSLKPASNNQPTAPQSLPQPPSPAETLQPGFNEISSAPNKPVRVGITLKSPSWVRVSADGKTQFEGVLPQGSYRSWAANKQVTVRAGNAGGVLVAFNNEKAKELGPPGQVQEVTFAAATPRS